MTSILTNNGAMVALQTLKSINKNLADTQSQISTGKKVASAKDSAAVFAITKVMEADVAGFKAVSESLALGQSTVAVAANGAQQVGELLSEIKGKIVAANEDNVDRTKLNDEVSSLRDQVNSIVTSAQFNGLNLLDGSQDGAGGFSVLSSLNRASDGTVTTGNVSFNPQETNLSTSSGTALTIASAANTTVAASNVFVVSNQDASAAVGTVTSGEYSFTLGDADGTAVDDGVTIGGFDFQTNAANTGGSTAVSDDIANDTSNTGGLIAGDSIQLAVGNVSARYTVNEGDSQADISAGLRASLVENGLDTTAISVTVEADGDLNISNLTNATDITVTASSSRAAGGLAGLDAIDVSTEAGAQSALSDIENYIQSAVDAQAQLGTTAKRLEIQNNFLSTQIDSFKSGIGALVDADLEEVSARLQALQVQQQLGVQALSIANQAPQTILSLFR